ncbi:MAG: DUF4173 domain-containing protein [Cytophagales bacterium]|nr:DUF4173 domain-containing protein [Cytophagales bacterium]
MKLKNILIILLTIAYSYLFYQEYAGINFFIFNLLLVAGSIATNTDLIKQKSFVVVALGCIISSLGIVLYSYSLGIIANILSLILLAHYSHHYKSTLIVVFFHFLYSFFLVVPRLVRKKREENKKASWLSSQNLLIVSTSLIISSLFLLLYLNSNAIFSSWFYAIEWNFISFTWLLFTLSGVLLMLVFFYYQQNQEVAKIDADAKNQLTRVRTKNIMLKNLSKGIFAEYKLGVVLLLLLNFLLVFVNSSDIYYFITRELPEGVNYTDFLHQGVYTLIFSILCAIFITLFFFRGKLNFFSKNKALKVLAYVWLFQNLLLVMSILGKNTIYIQSSGVLTYKRIGVYIYLLLTTVGLVFTFLKVYQIKSNWYLTRKVSWAFYTILMLSTLFNWDKLIAIHNFQHNKIEYVMSLTPNTYPILWDNKNLLNTPQQEVLEGRINRHQNRIKDGFISWASWNFTYKKIK